MQSLAIAKAQVVCPVKNEVYEATLHPAKAIGRSGVAIFLTQWYAFSASVPEILCIAAAKASCESERKNIVANLYSELGLDTDGMSHPTLLEDLILKATGIKPGSDLVLGETRIFLSDLKHLMQNGSSALNAGVMLALEAVAYNILEVLKEILEKSGNKALSAHPYIAIHEEVEAMHIDKTQENIELHDENRHEVARGYTEMNNMWRRFWQSAYRTLVANHV